MRILMVAHTFLPETRGGMENHAYNLAQYLLSQGHEVGMFYRFRDRDLEEYQLFEDEWESMRTFKFARNYRNPMPTPFPFYDRQAEVLFEGVLDAFQPDLVHVHHLADLSTTLPAAAKRRGLPTIATVHDYWPMCFMSHLRTPDGIVCPGPDEGLRCVECLWKKQLTIYEPVNVRARARDLGFWESVRRAPRFGADWLYARMAAGNAHSTHANLRNEMIALTARNDHMRRVHTQFDVMISPSRFLIEKFAEWGVPETNFRHLYNSVSASLRELRAERRKLQEPVEFGFMGTMYPPKGAHVLVEAFKLLNSDRATLHLWGGIPNVTAEGYANDLVAQAEGVPNLIFEGSFPPEQLPQVLRQTDVLVVPSVWYENNPLVILEAQSAGIPVLAGDAGGMAELVDDDKTGLLFRMGDAQDLAEKMGMMLDLGRLERYGAAVKPPWSHEEMGAEVEKIYRELVA
jgi:glycosyltransferase involved in cell wall biosynthesis